VKFTLRQLQVFLATARLQRVSHAADELAMSQSAASGALQDLESRYDTLLFDRIGKRLKLNAQGALLRPMAEALLDQAAEVEVTLERKSVAGSLSIGATLTIGNYLAIPMLADYRSQYPQVDVQFHVANTQHIAEQVLNYEVDIGLIEGEYPHRDLSVQPWRRDQLDVFCHAKHPLASKSKITDRDLIKEKWILREPGSGTRQTFDRVMHDLLSELDIYLQLEHTEAIKRSVRSGLGIGCLSHLTLVESYQNGSLVPLATTHRQFNRQFYFASHKKKFHSIALQQWVELCKSDSYEKGNSVE
jgi:DNA-binding transcriptional LysR family regulator